MRFDLTIRSKFSTPQLKQRTVLVNAQMQITVHNYPTPLQSFCPYHTLSLPPPYVSLRTLRPVAYSSTSSTLAWKRL